MMDLSKYNIIVDDNNNRIIGSGTLTGKEIVFTDAVHDNICFIEDDARLENSRIVFNGSNGLVFIRGGRSKFYGNITINNNCSFVFGRNNYINGPLNVIVSEQTAVVIGDECALSFGIWLRTADPHLIYDGTSHRRINISKNIVVGDHVWIGQNALLLKGSYIGSGTIIGANSVVSGKKTESNASYGGNPVRLIKPGIFWDAACVHTWIDEQTTDSMDFPQKKWKYKHNEDSFTFEEIQEMFSKDKLSEERLLAAYDIYVEKYNKNRFSALTSVTTNPNIPTRIKRKLKKLF